MLGTPTNITDVLKNTLLGMFVDVHKPFYLFIYLAGLSCFCLSLLCHILVLVLPNQSRALEMMLFLLLHHERKQSWIIHLLGWYLYYAEMINKFATYMLGLFIQTVFLMNPLDPNWPAMVRTVLRCRMVGSGSILCEFPKSWAVVGLWYIHQSESIRPKDSRPCVCCRPPSLNLP